MQYANHPDVARFRGVNPYYAGMRYDAAPMPYGRGGDTTSTYDLSGFTSAVGSFSPARFGWKSQSTPPAGYRTYGSPYNQYLAYGGQAACNCPGQICCKAGECVNSITACPEFTLGQMGNRFQNPAPQHCYTPNPPPLHLYSTRPDRRARRKKRHPRYKPNVVTAIFNQFGLK